nr:unnamed protein product [Digitaria exilis]
MKNTVRPSIPLRESKKNPPAWPAKTASKTPPLKDMVASITKYARPIFTTCIPVLSRLHEMLEESRLRRREERPWDAAESTSTSAASRATTRRHRTYMPTPSRSPGQLEKSTCARWPQKKAMCAIAGMSIGGDPMPPICIGGDGVAIELSWRLQP